MTELFTIGIVDSTGRGMEDILIRWEYIQQFLYSHGITRRTITTGEKQFDVSLWEHYGLSEAMEETEMKHVFNSCLPPTEDNLKRSFVFWKDKKFQSINFSNTNELRGAETNNSHNFCVFKREEHCEMNAFNYSGFMKCSDESIQSLPVELNYSESTESTFPILQKKIKEVTVKQKFPFMIFIMARRPSKPSEISTVGE